MRIGIIGLGLVGRAIARRLLEANHEVVGYDIAASASEAATKAGVTILEDAQAVGHASKLLILSLLTSDDRRALLWGRQALAAVIGNDTIILDTTTARPEDISDDHARLARQGVRLVDVCLSGSSQVVAEGRAIALIGDTEKNATYADILKLFTRSQHYFDRPGQGNRAKLIVNLVFGLHRAVLAEALGLAMRGGFDIERILAVLREGETYSVAMDTKGPKMISGKYDPVVARLSQHAKDVGLILEYARQVGAPVPLCDAHIPFMRKAVAEGWGDADNAAIFEAYRPMESGE